MDQNNNEEALKKLLELLQVNESSGSQEKTTHQRLTGNPILQTTSGVSGILCVLGLLGYEKILDSVGEDLMPRVKESVMEELKDSRKALLSSLDLDSRFEELEGRLEGLEDLSEEEKEDFQEELEQLEQELQRLKVIIEYRGE